MLLTTKKWRLLWRKKIIALLLSTSICLSVSNERASAISFQQNDMMGYLQTYIKNEKSKYTTDLKENIEAFLNENEVFDAELQTLSDEEIEKINRAQDINVVTKYFCVSDEDTKEVAKSEIDEVLEESIKQNGVEGNYLLRKFKGVEPDIKSDFGEDGYLKATLTSYEYKNHIIIHGYNTWIRQPECRYNDFYGIMIKQISARFDLSSQEASYSYTYKEEYSQNGKTISSETKGDIITPKLSENIEFLSNMGSASTDLVGARVNLKNNKTETTDSFSHTQKVLSQTCTIKAKVLKRDSKYIDFVSFYSHGKKSYSGSNLSVGVSLSAGGPSLDITYSPGNRKVTDYWTKQANATLSLDKYYY